MTNNVFARLEGMTAAQVFGQANMSGRSENQTVRQIIDGQIGFIWIARTEGTVVRIETEKDVQETVDRLSKIPGIAKASPCFQDVLEPILPRRRSFTANGQTAAPA
jgi:hypothetical protein